MNDSILISIKKLLGIFETDNSFDTDVIIYINSAIAILRQLGIGPLTGYSISDEKARWSDYLSDNPEYLEPVKTYIFLKTKMVFDPPLNSSVLEAYKEQIKELEWRLNVTVDPQLF